MRKSAVTVPPGSSRRVKVRAGSVLRASNFAASVTAKARRPEALSQDALIPCAASQSASSVPLCRKAPYQEQSDRLAGVNVTELLGSRPRSRFVPPSEPSGFI